MTAYTRLSLILESPTAVYGLIWCKDVTTDIKEKDSGNLKNVGNNLLNRLDYSNSNSNQA